jgi:hypothetical protein
MDTRVKQMYEIDKILFFDTINKFPNLENVTDWNNQTRVANMMAFNRIQEPFQAGFYKLSVGKKLPMFTFLPQGGNEIF